MLFMKLLNTPHHQRSFFSKTRNTFMLKSHLTIGQYFLAKGCDLCLPSVYESSVLLLHSLIEQNSTNLRKVDALLTSQPSHLFKNLPIMVKNSFYYLIGVICLFSLTFVKIDSNEYSRFSFNRLSTLRLLVTLVDGMMVTSPQMTEMLEKVCLQTMVGTI